MQIFLSERKTETTYEVQDVFEGWSSIKLDVDPELAEEWREVIVRYDEVQEEIKQCLEDS